MSQIKSQNKASFLFLSLLIINLNVICFVNDLCKLAPYLNMKSYCKLSDRYLRLHLNSLKNKNILIKYLNDMLQRILILITTKDISKRES